MLSTMRQHCRVDSLQASLGSSIAGTGNLRQRRQLVHGAARECCLWSHASAVLQQLLRSAYMRSHCCRYYCRKRISLYAHITDIMFDYGSLGGPVTKATVSDSSNGEIRDVTLDKQENHYEAVNKLWDQITCPVVQ